MKKKILILFLFIFILIFIFSITNLIIYHKDMNTNNNIYNSLLDEIIINKDNTGETFDFIKLLSKNEDSVGWIQFSEKINYPILQAKDNDYYLRRDFNKKKNQAGSIFMDYRNESLDDLNVVIYGHAMSNGTMFASLSDVFQKNFFDKEENNYITIYDKNNLKHTYQIFSYYVIESEDYYITTHFKDELSHQQFIDTITSRSEKRFAIPVNTEDHILTLSTCAGSGATTKRRVIHAKKIIYDNN